jgi:hypothetical protein
MMRLRGEANILRAFWLNEVLPVIEAEFDARIQSGEELPLHVPEANEFAEAYVRQFLELNGHKSQTPFRLG